MRVGGIMLAKGQISLSNAQINRYKRHLILPEVGLPGQLELLNSKVLCIGTGGARVADCAVSGGGEYRARRCVVLLRMWTCPGFTNCPGFIGRDRGEIRAPTRPVGAR
jgi:hypothetical protein